MDGGIAAAATQASLERALPSPLATALEAMHGIDPAGESMRGLGDGDAGRPVAAPPGMPHDAGQSPGWFAFVFAAVLASLLLAIALAVSLGCRMRRLLRVVRELDARTDGRGESPPPAGPADMSGTATAAGEDPALAGAVAAAPPPASMAAGASTGESTPADDALLAHLNHELRVSCMHIAPQAKTAAAGEGRPGDGGLDSNDQRILNNVRRLQRLFDQALDLGIIGGPGLRADAKVHDIHQVLAAVLAVMQPHAGKRRFQFDTAALPAVMPWRFDANQIEKVLANLVSNAIKFSSPDGTITLSVDYGDEMVGISIEDHGVDIDAVDLARLFDPRSRALRAPKHGQGGAGLGLAVSRRFAELHGGGLDVRVGADGSKCFCLSLPRRHMADDVLSTHAFGKMARFEAEAVFGPTVASGAPEERRPVVLVVDDRSDSGSWLCDSLAARFDVGSERANALTVAHVRRTLPDLVVIDLSAWPPEGLPSVRLIRDDPVAARIPIMVIAPSSAGCDRARALKAGADEYLDRPATGAAVLSRALALVDERRRLGPPSRDWAISESRAETRRHVFLELVRKVIGDHLHDDEFSVEQLADKLHTSRYQLFRRVKQLSGRSPQELITEARLERAAALLARQAGSVSEIAYTVGYGSLPHFSRSFRRKFGVPPSEFAGGADRRS